MRHQVRLLVAALLAVGAFAWTCPLGEGVPHFSVDARNSTYDAIFSGASPSDKSFILAKWPRVLVSFPCFANGCDNFAANWYPNGWVYKDSYAASNSQYTAFILKDGSNNLLCIPFPANCNPCSQNAADIGSPAFRTAWINDATSLLANGPHKGLLMDDMNDDLSRVGSCNGGVQCDCGAGGACTGANCPIDPRTGLKMTNANWRLYLAQFAETVKAAFPGEEIVHNPVFFLGTPDSDASIDRRVRASTVQSMERAVVGSVAAGANSVDNYMAYIDQCHARGVNVWHSPNAGATSTPALREYVLAAYMLTSNGNDYVGSQGVPPATDGGTVTDFWVGWNVNLGNALAPRFQRGDGVWERDFTNGFAYLNDPGAPTRTVSFGGTFHRIDGTTASSVNIAAAQGVVIFP